MEIRVLKIAVCDDKEKWQNNVVRLLNKIDSRHKVEAFVNGTDLLNSKTRFDIIYLDIQMPEINGIEVARKIRQRDKDVILIFLTNYFAPENIAEGYTVDAHGFLKKPRNADDEDAFGKFSKVLESAEKKIFDIKVVKISGVRINKVDKYGRCDKDQRKDGERETIVVKQKDIILIIANEQTSDDRGAGVYFHTKSDGIIYSNIALRNCLKTLEIDSPPFSEPRKAYIFAFDHMKSIIMKKYNSAEVAMNYTDVVAVLSHKIASSLQNEWDEYTERYAKIRGEDMYDD